MNIPGVLNAGDKISWTESISGYPATDGWTLSYAIRSKDKPPITIAASPSGSDYSISILPATTALWEPGSYQWQAYVTKGSPTITDKVTLARGTLQIKPNLTAFTAITDPRSHVKKVLDALEAVIEGKATSDQLSYSIAGRSISKLSPAEILKWRDLYKAEYQSELNAEKISQGLDSGNPIRVRFNRV